MFKSRVLLSICTLLLIPVSFASAQSRPAGLGDISDSQLASIEHQTLIADEEDHDFYRMSKADEDKPDPREKGCSTYTLYCDGTCKTLRQSLGQKLDHLLHPNNPEMCMLVTGSCMRPLLLCDCNITSGYVSEEEVPCAPPVASAKVAGGKGGVGMN